MQETGGIISRNFSPLLPSPTHFCQGFLWSTFFQYPFLSFAEIFTDNKMEIHGLVFPSVGFVEVVNMVSMICSGW